MNRLEQFFIERILPFSPFGATNFYPYEPQEITAEVIDAHGEDVGVSLNVYQGCFTVKTGVTAKLETDDQQTIIIQDFRGRPGHTPGAKIQTPDGVITLSPENRSFDSPIGFFLYLLAKKS